MRKRVYIETSIPSFYFEIRPEPEMGLLAVTGHGIGGIIMPINMNLSPATLF